MRWACPICGSRDYMRVVPSRGKQEYASQFFTCLGCSVLFVEPMLFARATEVRDIYPQASEMAHVDSNERLASALMLIAATLWLIGSALFALYARNWGSYGETYGALGGVVVLLMHIRPTRSARHQKR